MDESILGAWRTCADGRCHHFLRGKALCGSRARTTGLVPSRRPVYNNYVRDWLDVRGYCPTCKLLNAERWTDPSGEPAQSG